MPRYYFHARGPTRYVADQNGFELPSAQAAYDLAVQTIHDIANDPVELRGHADWTMEVADQDGRTVLTIPFSKTAQELANGPA